MAGLGDILDAIAQMSLDVVEALGYPGIFILMVMESMVFPVPSEAVMPPAGWLASEGRMSFWLALLAGTLGTIVGSLLSYWMGWYGLRPLLEKYGKYIHVTPRHLDITHRFFERGGATTMVFLSRFVPVVRHLISIPAGSARMPMGHFLLATTVGGGLWNLALLYAGFKLGENWEAVEIFVEESKLLILGGAALLAIGIAFAFYVRRRRQLRDARRRATEASVAREQDRPQG